MVYLACQRLNMSDFLIEPDPNVLAALDCKWVNTKNLLKEVAFFNFFFFK